MIRQRHPPRLRRSAALMLLTFAGCTHAVVSGGKVNLQRAEQIYSNVQELRQLNFKTEVPLVPMDHSQASLVLEREVTRHDDAVGLRRAVEVGELTGLYASGTDLKAQTIRMLSSQLAGFYDPQDGEMILITEKSRRSLWSKITGFFTRDHPSDQILIAHELTLALLDQYFGVDNALDRIIDNDDRALALKAVAEGDATLIGYSYPAGFIDAETVGTLLSRPEDIPKLDIPKLFDVQSPDTPAALRDARSFQYIDGMRFVAEVYQHGGWNAVNALYRDPPLSTRQVLDPALYLGHFPPPLAITVGGWTPVLRGSQKVGKTLTASCSCASSSSALQASRQRLDWRAHGAAIGWWFCNRTAQSP